MRGEGVSCGVLANEYSCAHHVTWSPNKLWRSTSIFNLCFNERKLCLQDTVARWVYFCYIFHFTFQARQVYQILIQNLSSATLQQQFRLYIPVLGIARPQPQFPHSCVCERFIYSQDRSTYFIQQKWQTLRGNI
jgi:hypothetical protein